MKVFYYLVGRLILLLATLLAVSIAISAIMSLLPGDAAEQILGAWSERSGATLAALRTRLGIDQPWYVQYADWLQMAVRGDLGNSLALSVPITPILFDRLANTLLLAIPAALISIPLSLGLGVWGAVRKGRPIDHGISAVTLVGVSVPAFVLGPILIVVFSGYLQWFPSSSGLIQGSGATHLFLILALPVLTLTTESLAYIGRMVRASMIETLKSPYVRMARLKGLPERQVVLNHALRNSLLPTVTVIAFNIGWLIGGVVVVEQVFNYPGIGSLLLFAIEQRDLPLIQATVFVTAAAYCTANLLADIAYMALNPRLRN